ncbi:hypothetical protein Scep_030302 [Stephania cephalantha]|uniref:Uncharacterized protein n=1 Tax=Stephania cephalantha TaxID=152367 RepID=A0AAP0DZH4_9MAGN
MEGERGSTRIGVPVAFSASSHSVRGSGDDQRKMRDVALAYIDGKRQMVCSLLRRSRRSPARRGGALLVAEEPSPTELTRPALTLRDWLGGPQSDREGEERRKERELRPARSS